MLRLVVCIVALLSLGRASPDNLIHKNFDGEKPVKMRAAPQHCCSPNQFESSIGGMVGLARGEGIAIFNIFSYYYDRTNERTVLNGSSIVAGGNTTYTKQISLFKEHREYRVDAEGCHYYEIGDFQPTCIPDNAVHMGDMMLGYGDNSMTGETWNFLALGYQVSINVEPTSCFINSQMAVGSYEGSNVVSSYGQYDISMDIKDPGVFTPPSDCKPGEPKNKAPFYF